MIVSAGETKDIDVKESSVDGVVINVYMKHGTANTAIALSDFIPQLATLKTTLSRNKRNYIITQDNLQILGLYSSMNYGLEAWYRGNVITYPASGIKSDKVISLVVPFGNVMNIKQGDILNIQMILGTGVFASGIDAGVSYIEFKPRFAIGYETGTPSIRSKVVQANIPQEQYYLGDGIVKASFLNFDKDTIASPTVITSCDIASDQLRESRNWYDLFNLDRNVYTSPVQNLRYAATQPALSDEALPYVKKYPQSFILHVGTKDNHSMLDNCVLTISYNQSNVAAGQNYVVWTSYEMSKDLLAKAHNRALKHQQEAIDKMPEKLS